MDLCLETRQSWRLVHLAGALSFPLAVVSAAFGLFVLLGYLLSTSFMYRPISNGEATSPLTALVVTLIASSVLVTDISRLQKLAASLQVASLALLLVNLSDKYLATELTPVITPFYTQVQEDLNQGLSNSMGINTSLMLFFIALAAVFYSRAKASASQMSAFIALAWPMVSVTGYAYGIENFYGSMSLMTTTVGFALSLSVLSLTADQGGVRAVLSPYESGRIARIQSLSGYLMPLLVGFFVIKSFDAGSQRDLFGLYVVGMCWFIILMVSLSAILQEASEQKRRENEQKMQNAALTDPLTGLPNRRNFISVANRELAHARPDKQRLWLLMIDVDNFKRINDTAGHTVGDRVLAGIGNIIRQTLRDTDFTSRLGGEEFAVLLADTSEQEARRTALVLLESIQNIEIPGWTDMHGRVTASAGVANACRHTSLEQFMEAADQALYHSKRNGRNRITLAGRYDESCG